MSLISRIKSYSFLQQLVTQLTEQWYSKYIELGFGNKKWRGLGSRDDKGHEESLASDCYVHDLNCDGSQVWTCQNL